MRSPHPLLSPRMASGASSTHWSPDSLFSRPGRGTVDSPISVLEATTPHEGAAPCSGWSNGTKSVFLRGLVPFNQLQQGWQCPVLGEIEEIRLQMKLSAKIFHVKNNC